MIDFACRQFKISEIVKCAFGLTKADYKVMEFFLKNSERDFTTEDISKKLKFNLSTMQRAVKKLHENKVIQRKQNNLDGGGYVFIYRAKEKKEIRRLIMNMIDTWTRKVEVNLKEI